MFKLVLKACLWSMVLLVGTTQVWSGEDLEDRFVDSDFSSSKSIFIDVKDASLMNVLKIISQQSGLSFIASQDVADKKISVYLNKIPFNQALQTVLDANGLTYVMQEDSNVFLVKAKETTAKNLITRVYRLKYASVSSSKINSTLSISSSGSSSGGGSSSTGAASTGGLESVIKDALSPDGKVVEDTRTNSLIITDTPGQFDSIESAIAKLDVPIPQILIEVEMVEVDKNVADQLGISYGATPLTFTGGTMFSNWPFGPTSMNAPGGSSSSSSSSSSSGSGSTGWNAGGLTAALNFLSTTTNARTLARPKILTLNNQTAQIQISTDAVINFQQTTSSTTSNTQVIYTPQRATTGVILTVTPQADLITREITMAVSPRDIDIIVSQVQPPLSSGLGTSYDTQTRGADSILKLKDGQSMVIGGLMDNQDSTVISKLPFLGDLPLIGAAFRSKSVNKNDRELIIFLTPHIIDDSNQAALKGDNSYASTAQTALDMQDASDRAQNINNSLNDYDMKKN